MGPTGRGLLRLSYLLGGIMILLHLVPTGEPILVNWHHVYSATELGSTGGTELWLDRHQEAGLVVRESLADILEQCRPLPF